jgi:hypothetical protein
MPRGRSINSFSLGELQKLIGNQKSSLSKLRQQRARVSRELGKLDRQIVAIEGRGLRGGGAKNAMGLVKTMEIILGKSGKPMRVADILSGVLATGYRSTSPQFRSIVNQALIKDKRFTSTERGKYTLKK